MNGVSRITLAALQLANRVLEKTSKMCTLMTSTRLCTATSQKLAALIGKNI